MAYPVFNEAEAMGRVFDKDLLKELLIDFSNMKELDWQVFDKHLAQNELNALEIISHSIKGVAGNLALTGIYLSATALNDALKLADTAIAKIRYEDLKTEVDRFRSFLHQYLNE